MRKLNLRNRNEYLMSTSIMTRSYYTTPVFVIVTIFTLFIIVKLHNTQDYIYSLQESTLQKNSYHVFELTQKIKSIKLNRSTGHIQTPESVRAIYISSWVAGTPSLRNKLISFIDSSAVNSVIIDIKDSTGIISFRIDDDPLIDKYGTTSSRISNIEELIKELHNKNIYVIGRLTTFQDPALAKKHPHLSFSRLDNGFTWTDKKGLAFINPKEKEAWDYIIRLAETSYEVGFDEINFDYIRYPSDGNIGNINYNISANHSRQSTLKSFYEHLDYELRKEKKIPISADIFGLVTTADTDFGIGQVFEDIIPYFDAIAPMVYPSHYSPGFFGHKNPNAYPYNVITQSMQSAIDRAHAIGEDPQKLRPWIQDFNLGTPSYGTLEVEAQIQATYDLSLDSYMSWDPRNRYTQDAYHKKPSYEY
jgi:hypothetical protein